jgi:hypothetical protein
MAAAFAKEWEGACEPIRSTGGFFRSVDGAPAAGYRAQRTAAANGTIALLPRRGAPICVVTGEYGARVLDQLVGDRARVLAVRNDFFGGNIAVAGLLVGADLAKALDEQPDGHRYLIPDSCLTEGRFLDGLTPADLPKPVEIVPADGASLRRALEAAA